MSTYKEFGNLIQESYDNLKNKSEELKTNVAKLSNQKKGILRENEILKSNIIAHFPELKSDFSNMSEIMENELGLLSGLSKNQSIVDNFVKNVVNEIKENNQEMKIYSEKVKEFDSIMEKYSDKSFELQSEMNKKYFKNETNEYMLEDLKDLSKREDFKELYLKKYGILNTLFNDENKNVSELIKDLSKEFPEVIDLKNKSFEKLEKFLEEYKEKEEELSKIDESYINERERKNNFINSKESFSLKEKRNGLSAEKSDYERRIQKDYIEDVFIQDIMDLSEKKSEKLVEFGEKFNLTKTLNKLIENTAKEKIITKALNSMSSQYEVVDNFKKSLNKALNDSKFKRAVGSYGHRRIKHKDKKTMEDINQGIKDIEKGITPVIIWARDFIPNLNSYDYEEHKRRNDNNSSMTDIIIFSVFYNSVILGDNLEDIDLTGSAICFNEDFKEACVDTNIELSEINISGIDNISISDIGNIDVSNIQVNVTIDSPTITVSDGGGGVGF